MKLDFKVISLSRQRPTEVRTSFVELYDTHLRYRVDFTADEFIDNDDLDLGHKPEITNLDSYVKKSSVVAIEKSYISNGKIWMIYVGTASTEIKLFFKKEAEALDFLNTLTFWWLGI